MNINKLLEILNERKITRYRLSKLTGISECTLSKLINKKNKNPRISTIKAIAKALHLSENEFLELCGYNKIKRANEDS